MYLDLYLRLHVFGCSTCDLNRVMGLYCTKWEHSYFWNGPTIASTKSSGVISKFLRFVHN